MSSRRTLARILWLALLVSMAQAHVASAVCESGSYAEIPLAAIGGEGTGAGGTGSPQSKPEHGEDLLDPGEGSGAGGTGLQPGGDDDEGSGTGGTGILGTITGFGSICVNGLRVEYDEATSVYRDGEKVGSDELAIGHVVRVEAQPGQRLRAQRIEIENSLSGPVTRVDRAMHRIWVMEQPVDMPPDIEVRSGGGGPTRGVEMLEPGRHVDVSGQRRPDGVVIASLIGTRPEGRPDSVIGTAVPTGERTTYVGSVRASLRDTSIRPERGDRVSVRGRWNPQTRTIEQAETGSVSLGRDRGKRLSIEGYVDDPRGESDFEVAGTPVVASRFEHAPERGQRITIEGRVDDQGRLRADRMRWRRDEHPERSRSEVRERDDSDRSDRSGRGRSGRSEREDRSEREGRSGRDDRSDREDRSGRRERSDREDRSGRD